MSTTTTTTNNNADDNNKMILVHKSSFFCNFTISILPTIMTHNIVKDLDLKALEAAVRQLVERNPILSGILCFGPDKKNPSVHVQPCVFNQFVYKLTLPEGTTSIDMNSIDLENTSELYKYVQTHLETILPPSAKGIEELKEKRQLFSIHILELGNGYTYVCPSLSHIVGDGALYYMLLEELNAIYVSQLNNGNNNNNSEPNSTTKMPSPIRWEAPEAMTFDFTHQSSSILFWISLIGGTIVNKIFGYPPTTNIILSQEKINAKKMEYLLEQEASSSTTTTTTGIIKFLSTNDIVCAALAQSIIKTTTTIFGFRSLFDYLFGLSSSSAPFDYFQQNFNYRNRWPKTTSRDCGNFMRVVPCKILVPSQEGKGKGTTTRMINPVDVRKMTNSLAAGATIDNLNRPLPFWSALLGRTSFTISNWASLQQTLEGTIFHAPLRKVVDAGEVHGAIIYKPNKKEIGILHKVTNVQLRQNQLLGELAAAAATTST